jgi:hypothetical protein
MPPIDPVPGLLAAVLVSFFGAVFFLTGTKSIEQIGHLPGSLEWTEGCIVQVQ